VDRRSPKLLLASALIVAGFLTIFTREAISDAVVFTAYGVMAIALLTLGFAGGGRALLAFAATYALGCVLWQWLWWTDDRDLSGIDDIPPIGGYFVTVPFALLLIAAGWAFAAVAARVSTSVARVRTSRR
jgi:hypothetical protein